MTFFSGIFIGFVMGTMVGIIFSAILVAAKLGDDVAKEILKRCEEGEEWIK